MENSIVKKFDEFCNSVFYNLFVDEHETLCIRISSDGKKVSTNANFLEYTKAFAEKEISENVGYDVTLTEKTEGVYEISPTPSDPMKFVSLLDAITKKALSNWILERSLGEENSINDYSEQMDSNKNLDPNDYDVYWNVIFDNYEKVWHLIIGEDEDTMSDDSDWYGDVYDMIDAAIPSYELREDMESYFSIYHRGDKYDGKQVKYKPEAQDFIKKMESAFPMWGKSNIKHL